MSILKQIILTTLLISILFVNNGWSIEHPLSDPSKLNKAQKESMLRVTSARVILADYNLLKKDFPELRATSNEVIDQWLLDHAAYVSKPQAAQENVNTHIPTAQEQDAYRPKDYGRAAVFQAGQGLLDVKGTGSLFPYKSDHSNGLASLGEAIREFAYGKLVNMIFKQSRSGFETVEGYAVIDLGFDIKNADGPPSAAGVIVRQAHERSNGAYSLINNNIALKMEKLLRHFGITSAGAHRNLWSYEWLNIQGTKDGALVDFGGFLAVDKFEKPLVEAFQDLQADPLMSVKEVKKLQPDPDLRVPLSEWGTTVTGKADPAFDNPWMWSHELAAHLRDGSAARVNAEQHIRNLLGPAEQRLAAHPLQSIRWSKRAGGSCNKVFLPSVVGH